MKYIFCVNSIIPHCSYPCLRLIILLCMGYGIKSYGLVWYKRTRFLVWLFVVFPILVLLFWGLVLKWNRYVLLLFIFCRYRIKMWTLYFVLVNVCVSLLSMIWNSSGQKGIHFINCLEGHSFKFFYILVSYNHWEHCV